jgi:hypothetical protein
MATEKKKPFLQMTPQERDEEVRQYDREILFEETRPLSPKAQALWERAQTSSPATPGADVANEAEAVEVLREAKRLAQKYYRLTGRPLGITGEIAEFEAIRLLGLRPAPVRQSGYDAVQPGEGSAVKKMQIKGRCIQGGCPGRGQRLGRIELTKDWDSVLLVLLDDNLDAVEIYEADRPAVTEALTRPGSRSRNERGALAISKFKAIGRLRWKRSA